MSKVNQLLSELPVKIDDFPHCYYLSLERDRHGYWMAAYECDTVYEGREYMLMPHRDSIFAQEAAVGGGKTIEEALAALLKGVRSIIEQERLSSAASTDAKGGKPDGE